MIVRFMLIAVLVIYVCLSLVTFSEYFDGVCEKYREEQRLARHHIDDYGCRALEVIAKLLQDKDKHFHQFLHGHRDGKNWYAIMTKHLGEVDIIEMNDSEKVEYIELATTVAHLYSVDALDTCKLALKTEKYVVEEKALHEITHKLHERLLNAIQVSETTLFVFHLSVTNLMSNTLFFYLSIIIISIIILLLVWRCVCSSSSRPVTDQPVEMYSPPPYLSTPELESFWFEKVKSQ